MRAEYRRVRGLGMRWKSKAINVQYIFDRVEYLLRLFGRMALIKPSYHKYVE